jgi:tetratricopeptide (TPR) repeat protein
MNPDDLTVLKTRALLETRAGNFATAEAALDRAEKTAPDDQQIDWLRLNLLKRQGRNQDYVAMMEAMMRKPGGITASTLNNLCWAKVTLNIRADTAMADCDAAIKLDPLNAAALDSRAFVRLKAGQLDGAIADADAALALAPKLTASLFVRGVAKARKGIDGSADLAAARSLTPGIDETYAKYDVVAPR